MSGDKRGFESTGYDRREFLTAMGAAGGLLASTSVHASNPPAAMPSFREKQGATVRAVFLYPPSTVFSDNPDGWWSWPGNEFDAEARHEAYMDEFRKMEERLGIKIVADPKPVSSSEDAARVVREIQDARPDGLLLVMFYNRILEKADLLLEEVEKLGIPTVFFIGLGVKHGPVTKYRRPGVYFIQSLDNFDAIEYGMRMIAAKKAIGQYRLLSINEADKVSEKVEPFLGITVRTIPFSRYAELFHAVAIDSEARAFIEALSKGAKEIRGITSESFENAARAHFALLRLLSEEEADGLTMNCLKRGWLKPCISFNALNNQLIPAACENDLPAVYTQALGQLLTGRPGFQHNPCYETERNHYFGSHCTCPSKVYGPEGPELTHILRRFAHTNEGCCAIQVFWQDGDPVTMVKYYPGETPSLDVYAGKVVKSHSIPPSGGCTTNVEVEVVDRDDACMVVGHHNLLFCGDFARQFRLFAQLYKIRLSDTGFNGPWPM